MTWSWYTFRQKIRDDERGILTRDGRFERILAPGEFSAFDPQRRLSVEVVKVVRAEIPAERALLLTRLNPQAAENFKIVQTNATEVAIVTYDGEPKVLVLPNSMRAFWTCVTEVGVEVIDTAQHLAVEKRHLERIDVTRTLSVVQALVEPNETALLIVDGEVKERLKPGRYAYWQIGRTIRVVKVDLRPTPLEVTAQEILTKDRIAIRVTLTAFYRVTDPEKAVLASADIGNTLYRLVQFAIREAVATRTLDEILAARDRIDTEVKAYVAGRIAELGAEIGEIGVKDVILPGEVRDLINKVVEAERVAKANLIRRQEETAATRSLLNTAKLMEDNPLLLRLKELEALERLVEKVGRVDIQTGQNGLKSLLTDLYSLKEGVV
ncbi:MAG: slipin family protein [Caulobacteraceae bacterium]